MNSFKLTPTQHVVLAAIERTSSVSPTVIAKQLKLKIHTVHHAITRLQTNQAFSQAPFIDIHRTGRRWCGIFLSMSGSESQEAAFRKFLVKHPRVGWCAQLNGAYSWGIAIAITAPIEVEQFLKDLCECSQAHIYKKSLSFRTALMDCPRRYLFPRVPEAPLHYITDGVAHITLDTVDARILSCLVERAGASIREISAVLGMPHTTVDLRLKKLRANQVLLGTSIQINLSLLNRQLHKTLVFTRSKSGDISLAMRRFALKHPLVSHFIESVGAWDFEYNIEVQSLREVSQFENLLRRTFPDIIYDTISLGVANVHMLRRWVSPA